MNPEDNGIAGLFDELFPTICRFVECLTGDRELARDIAQECFLRLHRSRTETMCGDDARFWLFRVARNLALNEVRKTGNRDRLLAIFAPRRRTIEAPQQSRLESEQVTSTVRRILTKLPEQHRAALLLREMEGLSYRQIAEVLGISEAKVKVDIFRARTRFSELWSSAEREAVENSPARIHRGKK